MASVPSNIFNLVDRLKRADPRLCAVDLHLVFLLTIPFILWAANPEWLFSYGNPTDAWIGTRYFLETGRNYTLTGEIFGSMYETYQAGRLSWILKGLLVYSIFPPIVAHYVLHLSMFCLILGTFYLVIKHLFDKHVAFIGSIAFGTYSQFHAVISYEWNYQTHDATLNILLTLLFMLLASRSHHWRLWLILSGATWVSALQSTYLGAYIPVVIFWYLFLNQKHLRHPIIPSGLYIFAGAAAALLIYCITSYLLGGPFLFFLSAIKPILEYATIFTFHRGYWQPFSYLLQQSKGIILPIFGGFTSIFILLALLIKRPKHQVAATVVLTQLILLVCLFLHILLHHNGHGVMSNDHMLAFMAPFIFLSIAGFYAYLLNFLNITNGLSATVVLILKAAVFLMFLSALIFGTVIELEVISLIQEFYGALERVFPIKLWWFSVKIVVILFTVSIFCIFGIALMIAGERFTLNKKNRSLRTAVIFTLGISGFLSLVNAGTSSIGLNSYDLTYKCGYRKDQHKSIIDVFLKFQPYTLGKKAWTNSNQIQFSNDAAAALKGSPHSFQLREPLLWYRNNDISPHPDAQCQKIPGSSINLTALYGGLLGLRGYTTLKKELLLENYLFTQTFSHLEPGRLAMFPDRFKIAILSSDQNDIQTGIQTIRLLGLKHKMLDQMQIKNGIVSFYVAVIAIRKDAREKAKSRT